MIKPDKRMWRKLAQSLAMSAISIAYATAASAQTIDYAALQELFAEPVTTSATGKPQKSSEVPVSMEIVSSDQIRRMGVTSLPEILNRLPGLTNWQATRYSGDIGIRGQNAAYNQSLLVLVNGRQVYIDVNGYTDWSLIPVQLEEIRQIEVVKGPTTALYGFNAVSGVVNIVTYNPLYDNKNQVGIVAGTDDYSRIYGFNTARLSDKASLRISGSIEGGDEFDLQSKTSFGSYGDFREEARNRRIAADSIVQWTDNTQLRLQASHADSRKNDAYITLYGILTDKTFQSANATLTSDTSIGQLQANLYSNLYRAEFSGRLNLKQSNQVTVAQFSDLFKWGTDHTFRLQTEFRHNSVESDQVIGPGAEVSHNLMAAGGMWNWAITPELEWTNAVRLDHLMLDREGDLNAAQPFSGNEEFNQDITDYSVNTGLVWKATEWDTLRASYGRGIGAPSLIELGLQFTVPAGNLPVPFPVVAAGNPNLEPTIIHHYELGYDRLISSINGKFRSSLFYKKTENISDMATRSSFSGGFLILNAADIGHSETAGIELGLQGTIGQKWSWDANYLYQNTVDSLTGTTATSTVNTTNYENTIPHHTLKAHLGYSTGPWEMDLYGQAASEFDAVADSAAGKRIIPLDGYYTVGGRVAYNFDNNITLAFMGSELTQSHVANNYGLENERRFFLQLSKQF